MAIPAPHPSSSSSPSRLTSSEYRKIDLQSPADLHFLTQQTQRAARARIDTAFPPSAAPEDGEDDAMRRRVEELVQGFVERVWQGVRANVAVNGVDVVDVERREKQAGEGGGMGSVEDYEPLDTKLASRIRALEAERESLTLKVTSLRRTAPQAAASNFQDTWRASEEHFDTRMTEAAEAAVTAPNPADASVGEHARPNSEFGDFKRWDDVVKSYERGTDGLVKLKTDLTETVARLERAQGVLDYMRGQEHQPEEDQEGVGNT